MGKKSRDRHRASRQLPPRAPSAPASRARAARDAATRPATAAPTAAPRSFTSRPFAGLPSETDVVALREFVPAATAPLRLKDSDRDVVLCSLLPGAAAGAGARRRHHLARAPGAARVRRPQPRPRRGAPAGARRRARQPGRPDRAPGAGPRLQDLVADEPARGHRARRLRLLARPTSRTPTGRSRPRSSRPTRRPPPPSGWPATRRRTGPTWATASTSAGCCPRTRTRVLDAFARLHAAGADSLVAGEPADRDVPRARPGRPGVGPPPRHRRRGPGRARSPRWPPRSRRRWPPTTR